MESIVGQRVEKHVINPGNSHYSLLAEFCHLSKNLYNHANYEVRQRFFKEGEWLRYPELDKLLKADREFPDYASMPTAQCAQQTLRILDRNWKSFMNSRRDWKEHGEKYRGVPRMPRYLKKDGYFQLVLTNQNCRLKGGGLKFPKAFRGFCLRTTFTRRPDFLSFQQVRIIPHRNRIVIEVVYNIRIMREKPDNGRYAGIDLGVNNLAVVCNNVGMPAIAISGRPLKSVNQYYNKKTAHFTEVCRRMNGGNRSRRLDALARVRNHRTDDYLHKASRKIVDFCAENDISRIVIGKNDGWKQGASLPKKTNQLFVQIPYARFIQMIQYKAEEKGIAVILTEESFCERYGFH